MHDLETENNDMLRRYIFLFFALIFTANCMFLSMPLAMIVPYFVSEADVSVESTPEPTVEQNQASVGIEEGDIAPDFTLLSLDGREFSLSEMEGPVTILNFWASWVSPCRTEMPMLQSYYEDYHDAGLSIVGVAFADNPAIVAELTGELDISYRIVMDDTAVSTLYHIESVPTTYVLDAQGVIVYRKFGELTETEFKKYVLPLLDAN